MASCITGVNYTVLRFTVLTGRLPLGTKFDVSNQNSVCRRESGTISGKASTPILLICFKLGLLRWLSRLGCLLSSLSLTPKTHEVGEIPTHL